MIDALQSQIANPPFTTKPMKRTLRSTLMAVVVLAAPVAAANAQPTQTVFAFSGGAANTTTLFLNGTTSFTATGRGWYDATGGTNGAFVDNNYIAGICGPVVCGGSGSLYRNWFRFNLASFTPLATSAVLRLTNPTDGFANTLGASLGYSLFDVTNFFGLGSGNSLAVYNDLGTGTQYGTTNVTGAQNNTVIEIALNAAALASINTGRQDGSWALGGTMVAGTSVVPEPSTWMLMVAGLAGIAVAGRAKRRVR